MRFAIMVAVLATACEPPGYGKHNADASVDGTHDSTPDAAPDASGQCDHGFRLEGHGGATSVWLTGDFCAWGGDVAHGATAFTLGIDGAWSGTRAFPQGTYQYKFIIDATTWIADPNNPMQIADGFGGFNSVFSCLP